MLIAFPSIEDKLLLMGESATSEQLRIFRLLSATLIGGAPIWLVVLIWDFTEQRPGLPMFARIHSFAIPLLEFTFILMAMAVGFSPLRAIRDIPRLTKLALAIWFSLALFTSFQTGNNHVDASIGFMKLSVAMLFLLALLHFRPTNDSSFLGILWFGVGCGTVAYIPLWIIHMAITQPVGSEWVIQVPGVLNVRHIGQFAFAGYFAALATMMHSRGNPCVMRRWGFPLLFAISCLTLALWTGSRGPTLAMLLGTLVVGVLGVGFRKQLLQFFIASALSAIVIVVSLPVPHPVYGLYGATGIADIEAGHASDASSGRSRLWQETLNKISQKPILGWGVEQFATAGPPKYLGMRHPHNFLLQTLFSGGIVSALLLTLIFAPALRRWRWPCVDGVGLAGTGCVAGLLAYAIYDGALFFSYPIMIFLLALATSVSAPSFPSATDKLN